MSRTALYRFFDAEGDLLYVGISATPWARWKQHKGEKVWWRDVAQITLEAHGDRTAALVAERAAIVAERPRYNVIHNHGRTVPIPSPDAAASWVPRWEFEARRSGYERVSDLYLQPEPNGLAVLCDFYDDELDEYEVIEVYVDWLRRNRRSMTAIPIFWSVVGDGICEVAPYAANGFPDGSNFLTHFTHPVDTRTGEWCSFYRLPLRHRFPTFWKALGYQPAQLQSNLPLASILGLGA